MNDHVGKIRHAHYKLDNKIDMLGVTLHNIIQVNLHAFHATATTTKT